MPQVPSTRWCPTPEQLMILEEMYRSGIRTPNASQIQQITAHLSYYGKIEGKNVFYWFQNHKARDRQKMRRRQSRHQQLLLLEQHHQSFCGGATAAQPLPHHVLQMDLPQHPSPALHSHQQLPFLPTSPPQFLHQGVCDQEPNPVMNLVCKLDACGREGEMELSMSTPASPVGYGEEWMVMMDMGGSVRPCCRPLKTLELFPTRSTGLREECSTTKSSSCSTSTTN